MINIEPMGDRVLVEVLLEDEKTAGGLYVPSAARETANKGIVLAVGVGTTLDNGTLVPLGVKVGDTLIFNKNAGTPIKEGSKVYKIVSIRDVIGTIIK